MSIADLPADRQRDRRSSAWRLSALARFTGEAAEFWPAFLEAVGAAVGARRVLLMVLAGDRPWYAHAQWPAAAEQASSDVPQALDLAARAVRESPVLQECLEGAAPAGAALAFRLEAMPLPRADAAVLVAWLPHDPGRAGSAALLELADLAAAVPVAWTREQGSLLPASAAGQAGAERLYDVLRMSIALAEETRFMRAALSLCNALAVRLRADRVCLGWVKGPYVRLVAVSHVEKFDRRASASRELESAMEEAWMQKSPVAWPGPAASGRVTHAHESYARTQGSGNLLSVPLQSGDVVHGVLTVERREAPVSADESFELRLLCDACALPLSRLHDADRWFGARLGASLLRWRSQVLGPGHVAWKLAGVGTLLLTLVLAFLPWDYRIEAPVALRSKDLLFVPAPFDGYLRDVNVEVGDTVAPGAVMLALDTRELVLEESMAVADELRVRREAEKSQAGRQFGDMQIALARQQASASKLELIRHQVGQSQVKAPFAGVVVEGELKKNLGAPVRKGDLLLKLASTGATYLEIEIDQAKIHEVGPGMKGEFAFVGRPELRYPLVIDRVDPVATLREGRNVFVARARTEVPYQSWWRPGMGGAARLDAGERRLIWVLTERTVRFLRHTFWL